MKGRIFPPINKCYNLSEMVENPYIIFELYIVEDSDDAIIFYKIDNGIIPSPEYGLKDIIDARSTERFPMIEYKVITLPLGEEDMQIRQTILRS